MNNLTKLFAIAIFSIWGSVAHAEIKYGLGLMAGQVSTDGSETEGTAADTSTRSKSIEEIFVGADLYVESVSDNGFAIGLSYVPFEIELGSGQRTDTNSAADIASEADTGTRKASADLTDFFTLYANVPMGEKLYALLGYHFATISTTETLNETSYPDADVEGYQVGFGSRSGNMKYELAYSDFDSIKLTGTGGGTNTVTADADALTFRIAFGF
jgi:hypothetical protein